MIHMVIQINSNVIVTNLQLYTKNPKKKKSLLIHSCTRGILKGEKS